MMIICVCNNLNDKKVDSALDQGAQTPANVQALNGCRFNCGKCKSEIIEKIKQKTSLSFAPDQARAAE